MSAINSLQDLADARRSIMTISGFDPGVADYILRRMEEHKIGSLKERMQDEIGDVIAACRFVSDKFGLDESAMEARFDMKLALFQKWDADPTNNADGVDAPKDNP